MTLSVMVAPCPFGPVASRSRASSLSVCHSSGLKASGARVSSGSAHDRGLTEVWSTISKRPPGVTALAAPEEEVRKLRTKQKQEVSGRREKAERRMTEKEVEAFERREDALRQMRGRRNP